MYLYVINHHSFIVLMYRKRPKMFVSETAKDDKYWEKRSKNNVAARRSREARRLKENQIALRFLFLFIYLVL